MWFSLPDQPIAFFAGLWRPTERRCLCLLHHLSQPRRRALHPKAMPAILHPAILRHGSTGAMKMP
jgi:putative SOS response-associated peptidase YedK